MTAEEAYQRCEKRLLDEASRLEKTIKNETTKQGKRDLSIQVCTLRATARMIKDECIKLEDTNGSGKASA